MSSSPVRSAAPWSLALGAQALVTIAISALAIDLVDGPALLPIQLGAFVVGAVVAAVIAFTRWSPAPSTGLTLLALGVVAAGAVLLVGVEVDGARRWLRLGPLMLHPATLIGPLLIWAYAARSNQTIPAALFVGATVLFALGPDLAAGLALTLGALGIALATRPLDWRPWAAFVIGVLATAWSWTRPDALPAVDHVELIVIRTLQSNAPLGAAAALAMGLLAVPFVLAARRNLPDRPALAGLAGFWIGLVLANLIANYPAPVIGYGASPVFGWLLSLGLTVAAMRRS